SAGGIADRRLMAGLRELLAFAATSHVNKSDLIHHGEAVLGRDVTFEQAAIKPDLLVPRGRVLMDAFLEAFNREYRKRFVNGVGFIFMSQTPRRSEEAGHAMQVAITLQEGNTMWMGYLLDMPLSLPDDRRDRTQVEVEP